VKEVRTPTYVNQYVVNQRHTQPGIAGGQPGSPDICDLKVGGPPEAVVRVNPSVSGLRLEAGERLDYKFGGGGGWGDPLARDPRAVLEDVWDEYVSVEGARRDYGVVITGTVAAMDLQLDVSATNQLRAELRAAR
jgi:N-methylhydantoinase B